MIMSDSGQRGQHQAARFLLHQSETKMRSPHNPSQGALPARLEILSAETSPCKRLDIPDPNILSVCARGLIRSCPNHFPN